MRKRRTWRGLLERSGAALLAVVLLAAGPAQAGCSPSDLADAVVNLISDGPAFIKNHAACASQLANPAFLPIAGGVTAAAASSSDVKNLCKQIENLNTSVGGYQQKVQSLYDKLPTEAQQAINGLGDINNSAADLGQVLSVLSCACALATESGVTQVTDVAGSCLQDAFCFISDLVGDPCEACVNGPPSPELVDCANYNEIDIYNKGPQNGLPWYGQADNYCVDDFCFAQLTVYGSACPTRLYYCYCPKPMVMTYRHPGGWDPVWYCKCPEGTHRADKDNPDYNNPVLARICLCDSTNELVNADGTCPPPCNCGCENNQIILAKDTNTCTCTCGCPDGQALVGGKCVKSCSGADQILLANGSCCLSTQVSSCGTCCPFGTKPDSATGSCVSAPPPVEKNVPHLPQP